MIKGKIGKYCLKDNVSYRSRFRYELNVEIIEKEFKIIFKSMLMVLRKK